MIFGTGVDIVYIPRIGEVHQKYKLKFLNHVFSDEEQNYFLGLNSPIPSMAGRFAAKEAFAKALGRGIGAKAKFREICIYKDKLGKPHIKLVGKTFKSFLKIIETKNNSYKINLSISHDRKYSIAFVVIEKF